MTESSLKKYYSRYNKLYFDNKLPAGIPITFIDMGETPNGGVYLCYQEPGLRIDSIHLDKNFKEYDALLKWFLLHEMAHLKLYPNEGEPHGQVFDEEMMRLAFRGAFHKLW